MSRTWNSARILSLAAALALVTGGLAPATASAGNRSQNALLNEQPAATTAAQPALPAGGVVTKGPDRAPGDVVLNVDNWDGDGAKLAGFGYETLKIAWGTRFTLPAESTPFTLTQVGLLIVAAEGPRGLLPGEAIEIVILSDPGGTGDPKNAVVVYRQPDTVQELTTEGGFVYQLDTPVTVSQGDLYIMVVDRSTDEEGSVLFYYSKDNGAENTDRSFIVAASQFLAPDQWITLDTIGAPDDPREGDLVIRGFGQKAAAGTPITGYGNQPVDPSLPAITNLSGVAAGSTVTLSWTKPVLQEPTITSVSETEPNNSPTTAQQTGTNVRVAGRASSNDPGSPGGFGGEDIEDWYAFTLTGTAPIQIDLTEFGNTDFDLLLYRPDSSFESDDAVAVSGAAAGETEHIFQVLPPGDYLVAVSAFDPDVPSNTNYRLTITQAPKVLYYNIFSGVGDFTPSAANFFGTAGGDMTSITITNSAPGSSYKITYVAGANQSGPSNAAQGGACTGGPTVSTITVKSKKGGSIKASGSGFVAGMNITVNGSAATGTQTIKSGGAKLTVKPLGITLTKGQVVSVQIITPTGGCTLVENITVK